MGWFDPADIRQNNVIACLSYVGLLFLVPLLAKPHSRFCRAHADQGIVLFLTELVFSAVIGILSSIPLLGFLFMALGSLGSLFFLVVIIIKVVEALSGGYKELRLIGRYHVLR
jgi:uncharacterized membrane protein